MRKTIILLIALLLVSVNVYAAEITVTSDNGNGKVTCTNVSEGLVNVKATANISSDSKLVFGKNITIAVYGTRKPFESAPEKQINGITYYLCFIDHVKTDSNGNVSFNFNIGVEADTEADYYFSFGGNRVENLSVITKSLPVADPQEIEPMDPPTESGGSSFPSTPPNIPVGDGSSGGGGGGGATPDKPNDEKTDDVSQNTEGQDAKPSESKLFTDIDDSHWAYEDCIKLFEAGLISGDGDGSLRPDDNISREELAAVLTRAFDLQVTDADKFEIDSMSSDWAREYLAAVVKNNIMFGYADNTYKGTSLATRAEVVTMIYRIIGGTEDAVMSENFKDVSEIPEYSHKAFVTLIDKGVINGYEDNTLRPNNYISRAELFKIISLIIGG